MSENPTKLDESLSPASPAALEPESCKTCHKEPPLCLCADVKPQRTRLHVLVLQHPQEPDKLLGSARLAQTALEHSSIRVGLSWASLSKIMGREVDHARWAVLYLGSKDEKENALASGVDEYGDPIHDDDVATAGPVPRALIQLKGSRALIPLARAHASRLEGIVVLDGTWSQAKTLWWRNAWLLKLARLVIHPTKPSLYGELRKEPRKDALSSIETIAEALEVLGDAQEAADYLRGRFKELLTRYRALPPEKRRIPKAAGDGPRPGGGRSKARRTRGGHWRKAKKKTG